MPESFGCPSCGCSHGKEVRPIKFEKVVRDGKTRCEVQTTKDSTFVCGKCSQIFDKPAPWNTQTTSNIRRI